MSDPRLSESFWNHKITPKIVEKIATTDKNPQINMPRWIPHVLKLDLVFLDQFDVPELVSELRTSAGENLVFLIFMIEVALVISGSPSSGYWMNLVDSLESDSMAVFIVSVWFWVWFWVRIAKSHALKSTLVRLKLVQTYHKKSQQEAFFRIMRISSNFPTIWHS